MKVLVIDDKDEELQKAQEAAKELGWECVTNNPVSGENWTWIGIIDEVDGVVTDLMWSYFRGGEKPQGLLVVADALFKGKPVVICTKGSDFDMGHHGEAIGFIYDGYLSMPGHDSAFGWEEGKDWKRAFEKLAKRILATS